MISVHSATAVSATIAPTRREGGSGDSRKPNGDDTAISLMSNGAGLCSRPVCRAVRRGSRRAGEPVGDDPVTFDGLSAAVLRVLDPRRPMDAHLGDVADGHFEAVSYTHLTLPTN